MGKVEEEVLDIITEGIHVFGGNSLLNRVLDITSDTLFLLDDSNRCVDLLLKTDNPVFSLNTQIVGMDFLKILPVQTATKVRRELEYTRETGEVSNLNYDLPIGEKNYYFKLIIHRFDEDHLLCQYRDIRKIGNTKITKSLEATEESKMARIDFMRKMNHEIRTPLSAIIGLSMLIADTEEADLRYEYSKLITSNSDQLLRLVTDSLEISKLDAGCVSLVSVRESLNDILHELGSCFSDVEHEAKLNLIAPQKDTFAWLDKGRVIQLLTNMINNSRKFTAASGSIEVGYVVYDEIIEWTVKDNGIGIPKDKQGEIFNRYYKVNNNDEASGLGLSICKSIVDQMNGKIEVESEVDKGSIFRVYIPLIKDESC